MWLLSLLVFIVIVLCKPWLKLTIRARDSHDVVMLLHSLFVSDLARSFCQHAGYIFCVELSELSYRKWKELRFIAWMTTILSEAMIGHGQACANIVFALKISPILLTCDIGFAIDRFDCCRLASLFGLVPLFSIQIAQTLKWIYPKACLLKLTCVRSISQSFEHFLIL